ncbi:MAG: hypothetical protein ACO1OB_00030 [Archangium sp.]
MNRALPIVSICLAVLAFGVALMPRGDPPPPAPIIEDTANDEELDYLKRRVEMVEDDNRALWDRVVMLERRTVAQGDGGFAAPPPGLDAEVAKLRAELRSVMAGEVLTDPQARDALKEVIREAEADAQKQRFEEMLARREKQVEESKQKWAGFITNSKLSYAAESKLNERLALEESERKKRMEQVRLGEQTWQEVSQYLRNQRRETDQAMNEVLDETQRKDYQQLRRDENGGRGGGGGQRKDGNSRGDGNQRPSRREGGTQR